MRLLIATALLLLPGLAFADPPGIQVQQVWSRAMPAGATGVVYLTVIDNGAPNTLTSVSSPVAAKAELHESFDDHGVMKMRPVTQLPVSQGKPATLKPGGYHIMLMGLKQPLVAGTTFPVTLTFAQGGEVTATATVEKAGASMAGMDHTGMAGMDHGSMGGSGSMNMHNMPMGGSGSK